MKSLHILRSVISRSDPPTPSSPQFHIYAILWIELLSLSNELSLFAHPLASFLNLSNLSYSRSVPDESRRKAFRRHLQKTSIIRIDHRQSTQHSIQPIRLRFMSNIATPLKAFTGCPSSVIDKLQRSPHVLNSELSRWTENPPKPEC